RDIQKNRSIEDFDSLPYICTLLNSSLWTYYGIIKPGSYLVSTVNGFGVIVETVYIVMFLQFAHPKMRNKTAILVGVLNVASLATILLLVQFLLYGKMRIKVIGFLTAGLNIIMYGSPLGVMKTVVTTKSVEFMPFHLSFFLCTQYFFVTGLLGYQMERDGFWERCNWLYTPFIEILNLPPQLNSTELLQHNYMLKQRDDGDQFYQ
ncbi:Bidirectional sugar transporter SWEET16, partial [Capsicum chinense]